VAVRCRVTASHAPRVAVFGAYGHTGRFIVRELAARGYRLILSGRDAAKLSTLTVDAPDAEVRPASVGDSSSLDRMLAGAAVVVNAAGPFLDTAIPIIEAALRGRSHYLDVTAEQPAATAAFQRFDSAARASGVVVLPAMGFYGGLGDLLITAVMDDWRDADAIELAIALDTWHPTIGTRRTGERNTGPRFGIADGRLVEVASQSTPRTWTFPAPFGDQAVTRMHLAETILVAWHLHVRDFHAFLNLASLRDLDDPATPPPQPVDASGRSAQRFVMDAVVRRGAETRRATASGRDIYAITAPLIGEAVARLCDDQIGAAGVVAPGAVFPARRFLAALAPHLSLSFDRP
jgi:NAD(P)-dependent dehydrogenase (short-subunit alcohol dehydrogenase family)